MAMRLAAELQRRAAVAVQSMIRRKRAYSIARALELAKICAESALAIQLMFRRWKARKIRRRLEEIAAAIKIQAFVRKAQACMEAHRLRVQIVECKLRLSIVAQKLVRGWKAKMILRQLQLEEKRRLTAVLIQAYIRMRSQGRKYRIWKRKLRRRQIFERLTTPQGAVRTRCSLREKGSRAFSSILEKNCPCCNEIAEEITNEMREIDSRVFTPPPNFTRSLQIRKG